MSIISRRCGDCMAKHLAHGREYKVLSSGTRSVGESTGGEPFNQGLSKPVVLRLLGGDFEKADLTKYYKTNWFVSLKKFCTKYFKTCVLCGSPSNTTVHHRHYKSLFNESVAEDVTLICQRCHRRHHRK